MAAPRGKPSAIRREIASSSSGVTSICIMPPPPPPPPASPPIMACMCMCMCMCVCVCACMCMLCMWRVACGVWRVACGMCMLRVHARWRAHLQHLGVDPKLRHRLGRLQHLLHLGRLHQLPAASTHGRWCRKQGSVPQAGDGAASGRWCGRSQAGRCHPGSMAALHGPKTSRQDVALRGRALRGRLGPTRPHSETRQGRARRRGGVSWCGVA